MYDFGGSLSKLASFNLVTSGAVNPSIDEVSVQKGGLLQS